MFFWARLKLTAIYALILAIIVIGFSAILYQNFGRNLTEASDDDFADVESHHHFVQNTLANVQSEILLIDLVVLVAATGASYALAGYTLRPLQRSHDAQKAFSENASHELRTPLAVMRNDVEVLLRNPSPTKELVHSTLHSNIEEIDRLSKMAEDLLLLARSENHIVQSERVDLAAIVTRAAGKIRSIASKKGISLSVSADAPLHVKGAVHELERVCTNILQNATEHTPKGGSIAVTASQQKSHAVVTIADTGSGISAQDLPHVFERFYKGEGASGSGLGLSIVKELIARYGGEVSIESVEGRGTTVTVKAPLA